ncbi:DUF4232 domain-containing protein [Streptomyces sp. NPDC093085]|uniref:DUF4232 domain-containing protein n=1 Tax=Streptomyces sp. NPDC093085 TaxID=3155068 RepID=UPI00342899C6
MSTTRTSRTTRTARTSRTRLVTVAAGVVLAALSLTACDGTDEAAGSSQDATASATSATAGTNGSSADPADASGTSGSSESGSGSSDSASGASGSGSGSAGTASGSGTSGTAGGSGGSKSATNAGTQDDDPSKRVPCEGSNTKTVAAPVNRPVNHMLLTVTNTGNKICDLYGYPAVRFGEAQSVPPVIEDSKPQAVVTLAPGQSGYAAIALSAADGSGGHGSTEKTLTVYFQGRNTVESVGKGATPKLPAAGVYVDDTIKVTYWQSEMDQALTW